MRRVRVRWILLLLCCVIVVGGAWTAWQAWQVKRDLDDSVTAVNSLRAAAEAGDTATMEAAIDRLTEASASADRRTGGLTWSVLTHLPRFGDDARGVRVVSSAIHDLAVDGARPLVDVSDNLDELLPQDGKISTDALVELQSPVDRAEEALGRAEAALGGEKPSDFVVRLRDQYRDLQATVASTHDALSAASKTLHILPTMLGSEGRRNYVLVFENNAEIRATGGLFGAVALVRADAGQIELTQQAAGSSFGRNGNTPPLGPTEAEDALYSNLLTDYFVNASMTPDFPRTADLTKAWWESEHPEQVDGVISIDPVALSYLLAVTGPVQVGDVSLTADNVVDELLHGAYLRYADPADQDAFFQDVARTAFDKVIEGADDAPGLLRSFARGARESRIYVHSFDAAEQAVLATSAVAGELVTTTTDEPQITVALNDSTGAKMSYYLRYDVRVEATYCSDQGQAYTGSAWLESTAPADAASLPAAVTGGGFFTPNPGTQYVNVQLFAPAGGTISDLQVNARRIPPAVIDFDGRPTDTVAIQLEPGQKVRVSWRMTSAPEQDGATDVFVTPGIEHQEYSSVVPSGCSS